MIQALPKLKVGDALVWSPQWLRIAGAACTSLTRTTYNASTTPTQKAKAIKPKVLASADLEQLGEAMKASVEKAEASDPSKLKAKVAALQALLAKKDATLAAVDVRTKHIEEKLSAKTARAEQAAAKSANAELKGELVKYRRALEAAMKILVKVKAIDFEIETDEGKKALEQAIAAAVKQVTGPIEKRVTALAARVEGFKLAAKQAEAQISALLDEKIDLTVQVERREPFAVAADRPAKAPRQVTRSAGQVADGLSPAEQRILDAVAWWRSAQIDAPSRHQVAFVAGYTVNGHFNNLVGGLRTKGQIEYPTGGGVMLTEAGIAAANSGTGDVPTRADLVEKVLAVLEPSPGKIFRAVVDAGGDLTREQLAERTNYTVNGHFNNMVGSLRSLGVIDYPSKGGVTLGDMFNALA
jgi:hypothetical protein